MKILLVQPLIKEPKWFVGHNLEPATSRAAASAYEQQIALILLFWGVAEPLALEMVAAGIPLHHEVRILDLRLEADGALERELAAFQPDIVGVTCMFTCSTRITLQTIRQIRAGAPKAFIIVGGSAPSLAPEHFDDPAVSAIALGEGERILPPLLERLEKGRAWQDLPGLAYRANGVLQRTANRPLLLEDLSEVRPAARHLVEHYGERYRTMQRRISLISTSRGCPFRCSFCTVQTMYGGRYRCLSAERAVDEIEHSPGDFLVFTDDNFLVDVRRARTIAESLLDRGIARNYFWQARTDGIARHPDLIRLWKQVGLNDVFLGLESPDDAQLEGLKKQTTGAVNQKAITILNELGINIWGSFIVNPAFNEDDFARLHQYVRHAGITYPVFAVLTPFPGTELWEQQQGHLTTHDLDYFDTTHVVVPTKLPLPRFYHLYFNLFNAVLS